MKKVLVIAYYFPPTGGGGVQRVAKFVKYLPYFGFTPVVLTARNPDFDMFDASLLEDVPGHVKVYKTYSFDPVRWYRIRRYGPNSLFEVRRDGSSSRSKESLFGRVMFPARALWGILKNTLINVVLVPDDYIGWIPFAVVRGLWIIRKERIDVIFSTGKPWSAFLVASLLSLLTGRPYILDLRDPWVITPYGGSVTTRFRHKIDAWLEKACFSGAAKVININEQINSSYQKYYPSMPMDRFTCIPHGFDGDDFANVRKSGREKTFRMAYVGTVYSYESPDNLLRAVSLLVSRDVRLRNDMRLTFVGFVPSYVVQMVKELRLEGIVETVGYLPHRESIQYMVNADVLVLLLSKVESNANAQVSTGKLFEYLASRRPILALIPQDTDAARLINELGAGKVVDPDDVKVIEQAIEDLHREYKRGALKTHVARLDQFERKNLTAELAKCLNGVMQEELCE